MGHCLGVLSVYLSDNLAVKYKQKPIRVETASEYSVRTDWLNVSVLSTIFANPSLLLFQIWYLANWIFRSLFPRTRGAVTRLKLYFKSC